jgi:hypothetical protein
MGCGQVFKVCGYCGEPFEVDDSNPNELRRKYCSEFCRTEAANEMKKERIKIGKRSYNVECEICGKIFLTNRTTNKTCSPECHHERQKKLSRAGYYRQKEAKKEKAKKEKQKRVETLTEVQRKARAAGMTYGKYMEMLFLKKLEEEREQNGRT